MMICGDFVEPQSRPQPGTLCAFHRFLTEAYQVCEWVNGSLHSGKTFLVAYNFASLGFKYQNASNPRHDHLLPASINAG